MSFYPPTDPQNQPTYQTPPQHTQYPPQFAPPPPPKRKRHTWVWVLVAIAILIVISQMGKAMISPQPDTSTTPAATEQLTTPLVDISPAPTLTTEQQLAQIATSATTFGKDIKSQYKAKDKSVTITENIGEVLDNNAAKIEIKTDCFNIQKAIWTDTSLHLHSVRVNVLGPLIDKFGHQSTGLIGSCLLSDTTASLFQWDNLDYATAWDNGDYDATWLLPSLNS